MAQVKRAGLSVHCLTQVNFFELGHLDTTQIFLFKLPYLDATRVKRTGLRLHCLTQFKPFGRGYSDETQIPLLKLPDLEGNLSCRLTPYSTTHNDMPAKHWRA